MMRDVSHMRDTLYALDVMHHNMPQMQSISQYVNAYQKIYDAVHLADDMHPADAEHLNFK
jgi:hypothetical protein